MQRTTTDIQKTTTRTAQGIAEAQRRSFEALTDNFVSFQRRNIRLAQGGLEFLKLQESNARAARDLWTSGMRFMELQQRNFGFAQSWLNNGMELLRGQAEDNGRTAEAFAESVREQQEGLRKLSEEWLGAYERMFASSASYAQEGLRSAQRATQQGVEATQQVAQRGIENTQRAAQQGLRLAEDATERTERVTERATERTARSAQQATEQGVKATEQATERTERKADSSSSSERFPIEGYDELNVSEVGERLGSLSAEDLRQVRTYEKRNKNRQTLLDQIDTRIKAAS